MWRKIVNPLMILLLKSPLHFLVSRHTMLISVQGRKTGTVYTTPVDYGRDEHTVYAITSEHYSWWKNLHGGRPVKLIIQGKSIEGEAHVTKDPHVVMDTLRKMYPNRDGIERIAHGSVAIRIHLA